MKKILLLFIISFIFIPKVYAKQIIEETHMESVIMLDVARRYYTVDEIKKYIDALSLHDNSTLQLHLTDDENVGIECTYLDQTKENATVSNGIYTNPITNKQFLTYDQVTELMNYAKEKNVNFIPEIDIPAHMRGFFVLAENKFGEDFVKHPYDWDNPINSGIAWGTGDEAGNLDLMSPNAKPFAKSLLDEYTEFFKNCNTFHMGFDEYTFRPEMKIDYANEIYEYLSNKGFKVRMWSDAITKDNISSLNNNIEITYWGWKQDDILTTNYATVKDLQEKGFKIIITNKYYLFFVPSTSNTDENSLNRTITNIENDWKLENWNYNYSSDLDNHNNILGAMICTWGEDSLGVSDSVITSHTINMYNAMFKKVDVYQKIIEVPDEEQIINNPKTGDSIYLYVISLVTLCSLLIKRKYCKSIL